MAGGRWGPIALSACSHARTGPGSGSAVVGPTKVVETRVLTHDSTRDPAMRPPSGYRRMVVGGVAPTSVGNAVVLMDEAARRGLVLSVGGTEALSIALRLDQRKLDRPQVRDLLDAAVRKLGGDVTSVRLTRIEDNVFYASVLVTKDGKPVEIDARPSDAIALAIGDGVPVFVAEGVLAQAGIEVEKFDFRRSAGSALAAEAERAHGRGGTRGGDGKSDAPLDRTRREGVSVRIAMVSKRPGAEETLEILHRGEGCVFATFRNVLIATWTIQSTGPLAKKLGDVSAAFTRAHPEGFSTIHVIAKKPPLPTTEAREEFAALTRQYAKQLACVGTVLEGSGFWASAVRSMVVGIRLLAAQPFEMQVYSSIEELAAWLPGPHGGKTGVKLDPSELGRTADGAPKYARLKPGPRRFSRSISAARFSIGLLPLRLFREPFLRCRLWGGGSPSRIRRNRRCPTLAQCSNFRDSHLRR